MALASWPAGIPYVPLRDAYDLVRRYAPINSTEMEDGPARQRTSATAAWSQHSYQIVFTREQFEVADRFVVTTLAKGAAHFMMPVGRMQDPEPWPLKRVYLEKGEWKPKPFGDGFVVVSFTLNVLDW